MNDYLKLTIARMKDQSTGFEVDQYDWMWLAKDTGAWDGPRTDWEHNHKQKYFQHVKKYDVCVQAGGCLGMYPRMLATRFGHVYTFEPDPRSFYCLVNNLQVENVSAFNCALGEVSGHVRLNRVSEDNVGMNKVESANDSYLLQLTVDSLNLRACDLILLDVESYEIYALRGARDTIKQFKPVIACENASSEVRDFLNELNYVEQCQSVSDTVFVPK